MISKVEQEIGVWACSTKPNDPDSQRILIPSAGVRQRDNRPSCGA